MKKHLRSLVVAAFAMVASLSAEAQYFMVPHPHANANPGTLNNDGEYPIGSPGAQTGWTVIHDATSNAIVWSPVVNLPSGFNFTFNNLPVTDLKASTSGVVTFTTGATAVPPSTNTALPSANIPDKSLCVWGMTPQAADKIAYKTFGTAPNRQFWIQYNSYTTPGTNPSGWTYWSIVLEETTNKIYFVDQKTANGTIALTVGLQINATTAFQLPASPAVTSLAGNGGTPSDNSYYEFIFGTQPARDMEVTLVNIPPKVALSRAPFTVSGSVKSNGSAAVTSFNLNYKIGNNATVTSTISSVNIPSNAVYKFSHPTVWNPGALGTYNMKVWASNINGSNDLVPANDTAYVTIAVEQSPRTVLHEVFTSATCGPCLPGNSNLHAITKANPGMSIDIKYQQNFPSPFDDPYHTNESVARRGYYGINSIPHIKPDGGTNFGSNWSPANSFNANNYTPQLLEQYAGVPTSILVDGVYYINPVDSTVTATATITPFGNVTSNNLVLHSIITEKHTTGNVRTNGETHFYDVMKKMMPDVNGLAIPALVSGQPVNYTNSFAMTKANYTVPYTKIASKPNKVEHMDSLRVVFFVQDKVTKVVYNAVIGERIFQPLGTSKNLDAFYLSLYPNPTDGHNVNLDVNLETAEAVQVKVINTLGQVVYTADKGKMTAGRNTVSLNLAGQAKGIYFVNVTIGGQTVTKKLSLTL